MKIAEPINTMNNGTCRILKAQYGKTSKANFERTGTFGATGVQETSTKFRIRKLTPKECWRLMGISDENFNKAKSIGVSNSSLYKQAGNGIVTNCVELIFEHLYKSQYDNTYICTDEKILNNIQNGSEPHILGGIGEINFGKQFRQDNRVYDINSVSMCLVSQPVGNAGGNSYLYADKNDLADENFQKPQTE